MADLSPAAQAVYDAWYEAIDAYSECDPPPQLAAAFRALADAVVPEETSIVQACEFRRQRQWTRKQILFIATELENSDD